jgi:hypothetical protein
MAFGIAELAGAVVFGVLAILLPGGAAGFVAGAALLLIAGIVLLLLGLRARRRFAEFRRLQADGISGTATVTGMQMTGVYTKGQPYARISLQVTLEGETYEVVVKDVVPMLLTGRLTDGTPVPVRADPANREHVIIDWDALLPAG